MGKYAENRVMSGMSTSTHKGVHHASVQGGRVARRLKERYKFSKEIKQRTEEIQMERTGTSTRECQSVSGSGGEIGSPSGERRK